MNMKKTINIGNKFSALVDSYHKHGKKRRLISEMFNIISEKRKREEKSSDKKVSAKRF